MSKKDYLFGIAAGFLIGLLAMPVVRVAKPLLYPKISLFILPLFLIATPIGLIVAKMISKKIAVVWQIGKFGVIGVLNTLVDWGVLAYLTYYFEAKYQISTNYIIAAFSALLVFKVYTIFKSISFIIANVNSYYWNKYWTFTGQVLNKTRAEFLQFFVVSLIGFAINVISASYVFNLTHNGLIGAAMGSVLGLAWNFLGYKFIVFKEKALSPVI